VLDTPGMRELQLTDDASGIADVFEDILALSAQCRFSDCQHESEPGCAVRDAIEGGQIDPARLLRRRKLLAEDAFKSASLVERQTKDRAFGKMVHRLMKEAKSRQQGGSGNTGGRQKIRNSHSPCCARSPATNRRIEAAIARSCAILR